MKKNNAINGETLDLSDLLSQHVQSPGETFKPELEEEKPDINAAQFEEVPEEIEVTETEEIPFSETNPPADSGQAMEPEDFAAMFINLLDGLQTAFLPGLIEKRKFSEKEAVLLANLDKSNQYPDGSPESIVLKKWKQHQAVTKKIPFNDGEKKRLIQSTATYAATTDLKVTPLQGLLMSFGEVVVARAVLVMGD
jgi:hypothetical protein